MPKSNVFNTVKQQVISPDSTNLIKKQYQNVQLNLLQHNIKFHPDQLKSEPESDANKPGFALNL